MFLLLINFKGLFTYNGTGREHTALAGEETFAKHSLMVFALPVARRATIVG